MTEFYPEDPTLPALPQEFPSPVSPELPLASTSRGEEKQTEKEKSVTSKKLVYYVPDQSIVHARRIEMVFFILFIVLLIIILVLCIVFLAPQTPYDLGPTLCCSPKQMYLGQRLNNGIWYLKLDQIGTLTLYKDDPMATPALSQVWSTDTANQFVDYALLDPAGTLQLINTSGNVVWTTPTPDLTQPIVPVAPYRMTLDEKGTVSIISANNVPVWVREPEADI